MQPPELRMCFADRAELEREIAQNLRLGRAYVAGASDIEVLSECTLVLVHPEHGAELRLSAQVVMVNAQPPCGMGVALGALGPEVQAQLAAFAAAPAPAATAMTELTEPADLPLTAAHDDADTTPLQPTAAETGDALAAAESEDPATLLGETVELTDDPEGECDRPTLIPGAGPDAVSAETPLPGAPPATLPAPSPDELDQPLDHEEELQLDETLPAPSDRAVSIDLQSGASRQERLRHLTLPQQLKLARTGELADRVAIERLYGKQVWETLLHNSRLSIPEVARIARKGTVPKPLLELILENGAWVKADAVRRALLSNPKIGSDAILKLLRATPKHELKLIEKGTAYGPSVRESARKLLKQL
jgi:hypothetical protein